MPLKFSYAPSLEATLEPAIEFLSRPIGDLFQAQHVIVPTAGVQAWLTSELAKRLGAASGCDDGIVANIRFAFPGYLPHLLYSRQLDAYDPWSIEGMTFSLLEILTTRPGREYQQLIRRAGGPLLAARQIADRFDRYHFRRPEMIRRWEGQFPTLSPEQNERGETIVPELSAADRWQFEIWQKLRAKIGQPSPPIRPLEGAAPPESVLVVGLQELALHQIELLQQLGDTKTISGPTCHVQVLLVHPSVNLAARWAHEAPSVSRRLAPVRVETALPVDVDPLVHSWLKETREAQWLLASQGIQPSHSVNPLAASLGLLPPPSASPLLARMQRSVLTGSIADAPVFSQQDDSLLVHRCHDLSRQAEVIHDALLHSFREIPGLAPHDVVIVSPQIAELAPHLEAAFNRTFQQQGMTTKLPLQIADRGISEVNRGAELLVLILELVGSRFAVEPFLDVATYPLVLANFHAEDEVAESWKRFIRRTRVRWGIDASHRLKLAPGMPPLPAHTWRQGLERMLLGAMLPDAEPQETLGIVPLNDTDAAELQSVSSLIAIFAVIERLDRAAEAERTVASWCDLLESSLHRLAGEQSDELAPAIKELEAFRRESLGGRAAQENTKTFGPAGFRVPFYDVKKLLESRLNGTAGRQPLRTGAITATSMIPVRGVPYKVVCVAGFDSDVVAPGESDGDDLVERQQFLGDSDPRLDFRRSLLDSLLAAKERLIITCRGMDVKNNATLPLATPLAELLDFAARHGVPSRKRQGDEHSAIEIFHPRHAISRRNFIDSQVLSRGIWSHDPVARSTAAALGRDLGEHVEPIVDESSVVTSLELSIESLAKFASEPLYPFVRKTLEISSSGPELEAIPATLPLELNGLERWRLRLDYLAQRLASSDPNQLRRNWTAAAISNGDVPVLEFGRREAETITRFGDSLAEMARSEGVPLSDCRELSLECECGEFRISGVLEYWHPASRRSVIVRTGIDFEQPKILAALQLLLLRATGTAADSVLVFNQRKDWVPWKLARNGAPTNPIQTRKVVLAEQIDAARARELLSELCQLYQQAMADPRGRFGKTAELRAENRVRAHEEFLRELSDPDFQASLEIVVFGAHPDFDEVFSEEDEDSIEFFRRFRALTKVEYKRPVYRYEPQ